ncbi:MAG: PorT family protein [Cyclobacteriaceae bacterium]
MKNLYLILTLMAITVTSVQAQQIGVGLKGGMNFPSVSAIGLDGASAFTTEGATGYHVGLFAKAKFAMIGVQPEFLYSFQRVQYQGVVGGVPTDIKQEVAYFTIPVMARIYLPLGINFQAGPQFGMPLSAQQVIDNAGATDQTDIKDRMNSTDLGINLGLGIDLPFGLDIHGRYVIGVSDVNDASSAVDAVRNRMIQVSIGYSFFGND